MVLRHVLFNMLVSQQALDVTKTDCQVERMSCVRLLDPFEVGQQTALPFGLSLSAALAGPC